MPGSHFSPVDVATELAQRMSWTVAKGKDAMALGQTLALVESADLAGAEALKAADEHLKAASGTVRAMEQIEALAPGLSQLLLGQQTAVSGAYRDRSVLLIPQPTNPNATRRGPARQLVVMMLRHPLSLQLHIYPESLGSRLGKLFLRLQDIRLGNKELDPLVMIKARDETGARLKLESTGAQNALLALFGQRTPPCHPQLNDVALRVSVVGEHDAEDLLALLEDMDTLVGALET